MDGPGGIAVEFKESEAFALLLAGPIAVGFSKSHPELFVQMIDSAIAQLRAGAFVGPRQWRADVLCANHRLWSALGLSETPPL
jgi:hypothetical protein